MRPFPFANAWTSLTRNIMNTARANGQVNDPPVSKPLRSVPSTRPGATNSVEPARLARPPLNPRTDQLASLAGRRTDQLVVKRLEGLFRAMLSGNVDHVFGHYVTDAA